MSIEGISCFGDHYEDKYEAIPSNQGLLGFREVTVIDIQEGDLWARYLSLGVSSQPSVLLCSSVGGSVKGGADTEGNSSVEVEGHISHKGDDGSKTTFEIDLSGERDAQGEVSGEVTFEIKYERDF